MKAQKNLYNKRALVRDLRELMGPGVATLVLCNDLVSAMFLLIQKALVEGKRVAVNGSAVLVVERPKRVVRLTPQGKAFDGYTYPKVRATIQKPLIREVLRAMALAKETQDIAEGLQVRVADHDARVAKGGK